MISLLALSVLSQFTPQEAQQLFVEGNDAYYKQDFPTAKARYEKLLAAGLGGPDVLFNLGTTALASGELGPAVLYLERARRVSSDDDIEANLAVARQRQLDQVVGEDGSVPFTQRLADALDEPIVSTAWLVSVWLMTLSFWWWRSRAPGTRVGSTLLLLALTAVSTGLGTAVGTTAWVRSKVVEAVLQAPTTKVFEFPGESAKTTFEVHAGLKVRIMETSGRFVRIRLPNALEGWTTKDSLVEI
jgi:hypothetical protein